MRSEFGKLISLVSGVTNPIPAALDRLGLRHSPYVLKLRSGAQLELRPQSGDLFGFFEIMLRNDYLAAGQRLKAGDTVIDIGANIGCFSVLAADIVGPTGRVFAAEPEESTYKQLLKNISLNSLTNVTPLRLAVGGTRGTVTLHSDPNRLFSSVFSSVNGRPIGGTDQIVELTTLDELMQVHQIDRCDFLKLDCEGAEHQIIGNLAAQTAERIAQITMEVHKVPGFDGQTLSGHLQRLGYRRVGTSTLPFFSRAAD